MSQIYRFKFSGENFSVELESTDPSFIDSKLRDLINLSIKQQLDGTQTLASGGTISENTVSAAVETEASSAMEKKATTVGTTEVVEPPKPARRVRKPGSKNKPKPARRGRKPGSKNKTATKTTQAKAVVKKVIEDTEGKIDPKQVLEVAKRSADYPKIKKSILQKSNQLNRILLAFYYAQKTYGDRGFSSGTIEEVSKQFGKIIRRSNIAAQIKSKPNLFHSDQKPRRGVSVKYKLTAEGGSIIEKVIKGN